MKGRPPKGEERALWRAAMRGVAPLEKASASPAETAAAESPSATRRRAAKRAASAAPTAMLPALTEKDAPGLDRRSAERLRRGALPIEARLDLHGMTQDEAHGALADFLARSEAAGRRCVLVITGKGARVGGVLRAAVPRWLNEGPNRRHLLAFAPAQPKDGGGGALYLLLRRRR
jgi:DNA-nicking Smr family endonuclease